MEKLRVLLFDWGDTLMLDDPRYSGPMVDWPRVKAMPGVAEAMPLLARKFTCAVVSNAGDSDSAAMGAALARVGLDGYFTDFYTSKELGAEKPRRAFFLAALERLGCKAGEACMIGNDYTKDIQGGKDVGLRTIFLCDVAGHYPAADSVIQRFDELPGLLGIV